MVPHRRFHRIAAGLLAASVVVLPACSDEDGDGATTDEEVGEVEQRVEEGREQVEQEVQEGRERVEQEVQEQTGDEGG
jgi:hypothetical protein